MPAIPDALAFAPATFSFWNSRSVTPYLVALTLTLAVETPLVAFVLARWYQVPVWRAAGSALLASTGTHLTIWFVMAPLLVDTAGYVVFVLAAEAFAWLAEAGFYSLVVRRDPLGLLLLGLAANLSSYLIGVIAMPRLLS